MKNHIFSIFAVLALALGFASCNDDTWDPNGGKTNATGTLSLKGLGVDIDDKEHEVATSRTSVDLSPFIIEIKRADAVVQKWTYAQMPEVLSLAEGEYTVNVISHELKDAEWDHPYYAGSKSFTITKGEITEIGAVTCSFKSVRVSVTFTDDLRKAMDDDCKVVVEVGNSGTSLEFDKDHYTSSAYFRPVEGSMTLAATFMGTVQGNYTQTQPVTFTDVAAGKHYRLNFSAKGPNPIIPDETGTIDLGSGIVVDTDILGTENINSSVNDNEENGDDTGRPNEDPKEDPDKPDQPDQPTPPTPGEDPITITCATLSFDSANILGGGAPNPEGKVNLHADNKIAHLYVKIQSSNPGFASAVSEFLPMEFDLAYPGSYASAFKTDLGFPVGNEVIGETDLVFNITDFIPLLAGFTGDHSFTITIEDQANPANTFSKTLLFTVK